ncbi:MAG: 50S ribosomal protein L31 [Candidatus Brocadiia bacterium]|nr:50S ribosomal protein L31 [Candidatus Brocadiia bacterium]
MKTGIHPDYTECQVMCGCGERFMSRATAPEIRVEVCSKCHPFYTGTQKFVDSAGRVEKFMVRFGAKLEEQKAGLRGGAKPDQ